MTLETILTPAQLADFTDKLTATADLREVFPCVRQFFRRADIREQVSQHGIDPEFLLYFVWLQILESLRERASKQASLN